MFYYVNSQAGMADADKQKEMDAKKAEVKYSMIIMIMITMTINMMIIMNMIYINMTRCGHGWRLRLLGRRTRRVS